MDTRERSGQEGAAWNPGRITPKKDYKEKTAAIHGFRLFLIILPKLKMIKGYDMPLT